VTLSKPYVKLIALWTAVLTLVAGLHLVLGTASAASNPSVSSAVYQDGTYSVNYTVYKVDTGTGLGTDTPSQMDTFMDKEAKAEVRIANGETWVTVVLNQAKWWVSLEVDSGDEKGPDDEKYPAVTVVSEDPAANKRTVKFKVKDIGARTKAYVHVDASDTVPGYNHKYDVEFGFDTSSIPLASVGPAEPALADGAYTIGFQALHATKDQPSSMNAYFLAPKRLTVKGGKKLVTATLKDSSVIKEFKVAAEGENFVEAATLSADEKADTRVVQFEVAKLSDVLKAKVHIVTSYVRDGVETPYEMTHDIRLAFDLDSIAPTLADGEYNVSLTLPDNVKDYVDGSLGLSVQNGQYVVTFKTVQGSTISKLQKAGSSDFIEPITSAVAALAATTTKAAQFKIDDLNAAYTAYLKIDGEESERPFEVRLSGAAPVDEDDEGNGNPGGGGGSGGYLLSDGLYTMDFTVLKKGTAEPSVMNGYVVNTAKLRVENKVNYVAVTLKQSKEITAFTVNGITPNTIESDPVANTRTVEFEVADLTAIIPAWVKVEWPEYNYFHDYEVDLKFGAPRPVLNKIEIGDKKSEESGNDAAGGDGNGGTAGKTVQLSDIQYHWAKGAIDEAVKLGFVTGFPDGTFRPDAQVSRAEFAAMIARALKLESAANGLTFKDLGSIPPWARPYIAQAVEAGLLNGYADGTFRSFNPITRAEIAVILVRALGIEPDETAAPPFKDADQVQSWARPYVATAYKKGLIGGKSNELLKPNDSATRAEAVTFILRLLKQKP